MTPSQHQLWRYRFQALSLLAAGLLAGRLQHWLESANSGQPPLDGYPWALDLFLPLDGLGWLVQRFSGASPPQTMHPAAVVLLLSGLGTALLMKRGLCSWLCPVFPVSELLWRLGLRWNGRTWSPPFWLDLPLRLGKYLLLAWLVSYVGRSAFSPHPALPWLNPVPVLFWLTAAAFAIAGLFIQNAWCRYLCPYGALLGLFSLLAPLRIRRYPAHCVRCHRCVQRCPAWLPVMHVTSVRSAECFACYRCIDGCPAPSALAMSTGGDPVPAWQYGLALALTFITGTLLGSLSNQW